MKAIQADATEMILTVGEKIQFVKNNEMHELNPNTIPQDWLQNITRGIFTETISHLSSGHPLKIGFPLEKVGIIHIIATLESTLTLRFFLPPTGDEESQKFWESITDKEEAQDGEALNLSMKELDSEIQEEKKPEDEKKELENKSETPEAPKETVEEKKEEPIISPETKIEPAIDFNLAVSASNMDSAPSTAPLPPMPPQPFDMPQEEKKEDPDLILNSSEEVKFDETSLEVDVNSNNENKEDSLKFDMNTLDEIKSDANLNNTQVENVDLGTSVESNVQVENEESMEINVGESPAIEEGASQINLGDLNFENSVQDTMNTLNSSFFSELLKEMQTSNASHMHLSSGQKVFFRVQNKLVSKNPDIMTSESILSLLSFLIPHRENNQNSDMIFKQDSQFYRVHIFKDFNGMNAVVQALSSQSPTLETMQAPQRLLELCEFPKGLVLIAGTSEDLLSKILASITAHLANFHPGHILSLEKHMEFMHTAKVGILTQREIGLHEKTFAKAIQATRNEDLDVLCISHLADKKSAELIISASSTSLVFACLNASSREEARKKLENLLSESSKAQVESVLRDIVLVRDEKGSVAYEFLAGTAEAPQKAS